MTWWGLVQVTASGVTTLQDLANWSDAGVADLLRADQSPAGLDGREYKLTQRFGSITF